MRRALALIALTALVGCGSEGPETVPPTPELRVALDFTPNAAHAPIYAARRTGLDGEHGFNLRILPPGSGSPDSLKLVTSGRADVGILDIHDLGLAAERGVDVVGIAGLVQKPLAAVIAQGSVKRPRDLEGRRVGVTGLPSDLAVLRAVVENDGGDYDAVKRVTIGFSAVPEMAAGKVDAVTAFWNAEGVVLRERGVKTTDFRVDDFGAPAYPEVVLFTSRKTLERKREQLGLLVETLVEAERNVQAHREASIQEIAKAGNADVELTRAQFDAVLPLFEPAMRLDEQILQSWADWDARVGMLKNAPDVERLFEKP